MNSQNDDKGKHRISSQFTVTKLQRNKQVTSFYYKEEIVKFCFYKLWLVMKQNVNPKHPTPMNIEIQ